MSVRLTQVVTRAASKPTTRSMTLKPATITQNKKNPIERTTAARDAVRSGLALVIERTPQECCRFPGNAEVTEIRLRIRLYCREIREQVGAAIAITELSALSTAG